MMSAYQFRWTFVSWALPTDTREAVSAARKFVKKVRAMTLVANTWGGVKRGAALICRDPERVLAEIGVPDDAEVRLVGITDKQFQLSRVLFGRLRSDPVEPDGPVGPAGFSTSNEAW